VSKTCPSSRCAPGAVLLGIVDADGHVGYVSPRLTVDAAFVEAAHRGRMPEKRFRFASPCIEGGCRHWDGERCAVADAAADSSTPSAARLPACSIRPDCLWFAQRGVDACAACSYVVTEPR
jgi:hypothetical protein